MSYRSQVLFVFSITISFQKVFPTPHELCNLTNDKGPQKNKACVFPFRIKGVLYRDCTNEKDPEGKFWCSTKIDEEGAHVEGKGHWGYCREGCDFGYTNFAPTIPRKTLLRNKIKNTQKDVNAFDFSLTQEDLVDNLKEDQTEAPRPATIALSTDKSTTTTKPSTPFTNVDTSDEKDPNSFSFSDSEEIRPTKLQNPTKLEDSFDPDENISRKPPRRRTTTAHPTAAEEEDHDYDRDHYYYFSNNEDYSADYENYDERPLGIQTDSSDGTWLPTQGEDLCGEETSAGFIVGGAKAKGGEFPFMAALGRLTKDEKLFFICGGTLINRKYILTAAHCHSEKSDSKYRISKVILGASDLSELDQIGAKGGPQLFDINPDDVITHEEFDSAAPAGRYYNKAITYCNIYLITE